MALVADLRSKFPFDLDCVFTPQGFAVGRASAEARSDACDFRYTQTESGDRGWILDGFLIQPSWEEISRKRQLSDLPASPNGSYTLIEWHAVSRSVRISNDSIGFRATYYWLSPDGGKIVLASSLRVMRLAVKQLAPDERGFVEQLLVSSTLSSRTLLKGVSRLLPNSVHVLGAQGNEHTSGSLSIPWGEKYYGLSVEEAGKLICETGLRIIKDWTSKQTWAVSLSGGYDSRFLTLLALENGCDVSALNLGSDDWIDTLLAKRFCETTGVTFVGCPPPFRIRIDEYIEAVMLVEHLADYLSPSWIGAYGKILAASSRPVINGFLGGPLTGSSVDWIDGSLSPQAIGKSWYATINSCNVATRTLATLCVGVDIEKIQREIIETFYGRYSNSTHVPYRLIYEAEFAIRQFGFVSLDTYNLFRNFTAVGVPFTDQRFITLFANLKLGHLKQQRAYYHAISSLDATGVPYASTSARLREPGTFQAGPQTTIQRIFSSLYQEFVEFTEHNRAKLSSFINVDRLQAYLRKVQVNSDLQHSVPQASMLMNAAILWCEYSQD
jgi:hypothetical protein